MYTQKLMISQDTKGIEMHFREGRPLPDFMVKSASAEHPSQLET